jgi:hypothetical protein
MKTITRAAVTTIAAFLITGCAIEATPIPFSQAKTVPAERAFLYQEPQGDATNPVQVKRDVGVPSMACAANLLVNGKLAATLETGEKVTLFLPPGHAFLGVTPRTCGSYLSEVETTVVPGEPRRFRITAAGGGQISILATGTE